ncbi:MAG: hypothetical protein DRP09_13470 [Candidatus Thorarchaeota archaeon]|nr:MAG: hypothetical protein DRP09_13470 [Candidatus Thorarchaeota archaeon]
MVITMSKQLKAVMEMLAARHMHPAMRQEADIAAARKEGIDLHPLVLAPTRNNPSLTYIHPERMLQELEKRGEFLNLTTLEFEKKAVPEPKKNPTQPSTAEPYGTYTESELKKMDWEHIRKVAKADPEIPGNKKKVELIKLLTGRPKFPL